MQFSNTAKQKSTVVAASLIGACAIHFVMSACGSMDRPGGAMNGTRDAFAEPAPCSSWQIAAYYAPGLISAPMGSDWPKGLTGTIALPGGWEPIQATPFGGSSGGPVNTIGALTIVRKCVP